MFEYKIDNRLSLRLLHVLDAEELFNVINGSRDYLKKWLTWVDLVQSIQDCKYSAYRGMKQYAENNGFQCCIIYSGKIVGRIGLHSVDWKKKSTSIGYWLAKDFQGQGIMTDCCKGLITLIFNKLQLKEVNINVSEKNLKSRAIPERLGFLQKGIKKNAQVLNMTNVNHVCYVMTRDSWRT